jgi:hypothetical protein
VCVCVSGLTSLEVAGTELHRADAEISCYCATQSGCFKILNNACDEFKPLFRSKANYREVVSRTSDTLRKMIGTEISPYIVDESGEVILLVVLFPLLQYQVADESRLSFYSRISFLSP